MFASTLRASKVVSTSVDSARPPVHRQDRASRVRNPVWQSLAWGGKGRPINGRLAGNGDGAQADVPAAALAGKSPARTSMDVSIENAVTGPNDIERGGFDWKVWFNLPAAAANAGFVVQEIDARFNSQRRDGSTLDSSAFHFWEAWPVEKGKQATIYQDKKLDDNDDQYFSAASPADTKGVSAVNGTVKFFEGSLPPDFKPNNPSTIAGILPSSTKQPPFWDGSGTAHNIVSGWDATASPERTDVKGQAGDKVLNGIWSPQSI
jgi:hypothetical protein